MQHAGDPFPSKGGKRRRTARKPVRKWLTGFDLDFFCLGRLDFFKDLKPTSSLPDRLLWGNKSNMAVSPINRLMLL
jgi:hypothetical protein